MAKVAFLRPQHWHYYDRTLFFLPTLEKVRARTSYSALLERLSVVAGETTSLDYPVSLS